jgi:hypothetical protein
MYIIFRTTKQAVTNKCFTGGDNTIGLLKTRKNLPKK